MNAQSCLGRGHRMASILVLLPVLLELIPSSPCLAESPKSSTRLLELLGEENRFAEDIRPALGDGSWSWENPRPQGNWLRTVFVLARDDVWAGGNNTLMHWDGRDWRLTPPQFNQDHFSVKQIWASDAQHVWAALDYPLVLLEWRDGTWVPSGLPSDLVFWQAIWGSGPHDVWAAGSAGVYHWDGTWARRTAEGWQPRIAGSLWGTAEDDVTVWNTETRSFHWDGASWQAIDPPPAQYVGGGGPGEPWFKNYDSDFLRFREGVWERYPSPVERSAPAVWSYDSTEAWAVGGSFLHFDGKAWSIAQQLQEPLRAISGSAPDQVWAVGDKGAMVRFNGRFEDRRAGSSADLKGIFGLLEGEVWAVGNSGTVLRRRPTEWETIPVPTQRNIQAMSGTSSNNLWVVGQAGASLHFDGNRWSEIPTRVSDDLAAVWASGPSDVWAAAVYYVGSGTFLHWDGSTWTNLSGRGAPPGGVSGFWGFAPDDLWAAGRVCWWYPDHTLRCSKTVFHFDGFAWTNQLLGTIDFGEGFDAIWGSEPGDLWAVGSQTYHWDGQSWARVDFPLSQSCSGVWGRAKNDVFAICGAYVAHWDGDRWSVAPTLSGQQLTGLWGDDSRLWVVGGSGAILRNAATAKE